MPNQTHVRHGLYLPNDLLDQLRLLAQRKRKSINKQIEEILRSWFALKEETREISRKELLQLPLERRHKILEDQAKHMARHYCEDHEFEGGQGDFFEYE